MTVIINRKLEVYAGHATRRQRNTLIHWRQPKRKGEKYGSSLEMRDGALTVGRMILTGEHALLKDVKTKSGKMAFVVSVLFRVSTRLGDFHGMLR
jgi:hypothetical protein